MIQTWLVTQQHFSFIKHAVQYKQGYAHGMPAHVTPTRLPVNMCGVAKFTVVDSQNLYFTHRIIFSAVLTCVQVSIYSRKSYCC